MTTYLQAIVLGIVQGITEWLPISSSGHLVITQHLLGIAPPVIFDIMLHIGTLLVIFLIFHQDIKRIAISIFSRRYKEYRKLALFILVGSLPTALIGFFFKDLFESFFYNIRAVAIALLFTGIILYKARKKGERKINATDALLIGIMQGIAIIPGISRSGATITMGIFRNVKRELAAKFSFLLAIPAIIGATFLEFDQIKHVDNIPAMLLGTAVAVVVGYFSLKWLLRIVHKQQLHYFSFYCWILGLAILAFSYA